MLKAKHIDNFIYDLLLQFIIIFSHKNNNMKKVISLLFIASTLFMFCNCSSVNERSDILSKNYAVNEYALSSEYSSKSEQYNGDIIVYITVSGEKYHRTSCRYLWSSKRMISLEKSCKARL